MRLALFDLDHTLLPFDSGMAWTQHLIAQGDLPPDAEQRYLHHCQQYVAGELDIHALHRACVRPWAVLRRARLSELAASFELALQARVPVAMRELVSRHQVAGDLCALVTATTRFIAEPCARLFGLNHVLATEAATCDGSPQGDYTGEIAGLACHRAHKLAHVQQWLARQPGSPDISGFEQSWFYSDSVTDLPLLKMVTNPVAVRPDERLRQHANFSGWPVI